MKDQNQLFCFTYAGGNASFFDKLEQHMPSVDFVKLDYAGHGTRHKEQFYTSFRELTEDLFGLFQAKYAGGQYAFLGYSMGSICVVEVLKTILNKANIPNPVHVFLAAHEPHTAKELKNHLPAELDDIVKRRTLEFGAVPKELEENETFWRVYLPIFRADYQIVEAYQFEKLDLRTSIPVTVFYSEADTPFKEIKKWNKYFWGEASYYNFSGGHFFIRDHYEEIARVITGKMMN